MLLVAVVCFALAAILSLVAVTTGQLQTFLVDLGLATGFASFLLGAPRPHIP